jgi:hypothetical protein
MMRFLLSVVAVILTGFIVLTGTVFFLSDQDIPDGVSGPEAEALRERIETATGQAEWARGRFLGFRNVTTQTNYFVDLDRGFVEALFQEGSDRITLHFSNSAYRVYRNGTPLEGGEAQALYEAGRVRFETDLFWLNPFGHLADEGSEIKKVANRALLVRFKRRPGEAYMIVTDESGLPTHWKIWKKGLSIGGQEIGFEEWHRVADGAMVSLGRKGKFYEVTFSDPVLAREGEETRFQDLGEGGR